jgi:hypothetical protein
MSRAGDLELAAEESATPGITGTLKTGAVTVI